MDQLTVTVQAAQAAIGIGNTKFYELVAEGRIKTIKVGRRTLVRTDSLRELVGLAA